MFFPDKKKGDITPPVTTGGLCLLFSYSKNFNVPYLKILLQFIQPLVLNKYTTI